MKKILILLLLLIMGLFMADRYIERTNKSLKESNCTDCKVDILKKQQEHNLSKFGTNITKVTIPPITLQEINTTLKEPTLSSKEILNKALEDIVLYKQKKRDEIEKLTQEFNLYKTTKSKEIKRLNAKLAKLNKQLEKLQSHTKP